MGGRRRDRARRRPAPVTAAQHAPPPPADAARRSERRARLPLFIVAVVGALAARLATAWLPSNALDTLDIVLALALAVLLTVAYRRWLLRQVEERRRRREERR